MDVVGLGEGNSLVNTTGRKDIQKRAGQKLKGGSYHARSIFSLKVCFHSKLSWKKQTLNISGSQKWWLNFYFRIIFFISVHPWEVTWAFWLCLLAVKKKEEVQAVGTKAKLNEKKSWGLNCDTVFCSSLGIWPADLGMSRISSKLVVKDKKQKKEEIYA